MEEDLKLNASELKTSEITQEKLPAPKDHYKFAYMTVMILGVAALLPWNSLIMALDFFSVKLPGHDINFVVSILSNGPVFITNVLMILFHKYIPEVKTSIVSLFLMMLLCVCLPLFPQIIKSESADWVVIFITIILLSIVNGMLGSLINGIVGPFPRD